MRPHESVPGLWTYECPATGDRLHSREVDYIEVAEHYKGDPDGGYTSYVHTDHLSAEELVRLRDRLVRDVRAELDIPFHRARPAERYERTMGQLPPRLLRRSRAAAAALNARSSYSTTARTTARATFSGR